MESVSETFASRFFPSSLLLPYVPRELFDGCLLFVCLFGVKYFLYSFIYCRFFIRYEYFALPYFLFIFLFISLSICSPFFTLLLDMQKKKKKTEFEEK